MGKGGSHSCMRNVAGRVEVELEGAEKAVTREVEIVRRGDG